MYPIRLNNPEIKFGDMKSRDLSQEECEDLLSANRYGRLGLSLDDVPYVVPISYVYSDGKIYLHSGLKGKKLEIARKNPQVCFEVDELEKGHWKSVVVLGWVDISDSLDAKQQMFGLFTQKVMGGHGGMKFNREELERMVMCIWNIEIQEMTGRSGVW